MFMPSSQKIDQAYSTASMMRHWGLTPHLTFRKKSLSLIALILTTKSNETKHHIHPEHKRETEKKLS